MAFITITSSWVNVIIKLSMYPSMLERRGIVQAILCQIQSLNRWDTASMPTATAGEPSAR